MRLTADRPASSTIAASSSATTTTPSVNIEVPIEMLDKGVEADGVTNILWTASTTTIDTTAYDGSPQYFFEIVSDNSGDGDLIDETVNLRDSSNAIVASITVPAGSLTQRLRSVAFTPNTGSDTYRLNTPGTGTYKIYAARIIIQQTNATKTRIYIPLASNTYNTTSSSTTDSIVNRNNAVYASDSNKLPLWKKEEASFSSLATTNPWTFEAVLSANTCTGYASLFSINSGDQIVESEVSHNTTTPTYKSASFSNSAGSFVDGEEFEVQVKSVGVCSDINGVKLFKAGLWGKLEGGISKAQSYYRIGRYLSIAASGAVTNENHRALIATSLFSNPTVYYEISSYEGAADSPTTGSSLYTHGTNDIGVGGATAIGSSDIQTLTTAKSRVRSGALSITSGDRFITYAECDDSVNCVWNHNLVIINSSSN